MTKLIVYGISVREDSLGSSGICNALDTDHTAAIALLRAIFLAAE